MEKFLENKIFVYKSFAHKPVLGVVFFAKRRKNYEGSMLDERI